MSSLAAVAKEVVPVLSRVALAVVTLLFTLVQFELNRGDTQPIGERGHRRVLGLATVVVALNAVAFLVVAAFSVPGLTALIDGRAVRGRYVIGLCAAAALLVVGMPLTWTRRRHALTNLERFLTLQGRGRRSRGRDGTRAV